MFDMHIWISCKYMFTTYKYNLYILKPNTSHYLKASGNNMCLLTILHFWQYL